MSLKLLILLDLQKMDATNINETTVLKNRQNENKNANIRY